MTEVVLLKDIPVDPSLGMVEGSVHTVKEFTGMIFKRGFNNSVVVDVVSEDGVITEVTLLKHEFSVVEEFG